MRKSNTSTLWDLLSTIHFLLSFCTVIFKILDEFVNVNLLNELKCVKIQKSVFTFFFKIFGIIFLYFIYLERAFSNLQPGAHLSPPALNNFPRRISFSFGNP
jgi:hypothetical protein